MAAPVLSLSAVAFAWPDGTPVFDGLDLAVGPGRSGLVGVNGIRQVDPAPADRR